MIDKETREKIIQMLLDKVDEAWWTDDGHLWIKKDGKKSEIDIQAGYEFDIPGLTEQTGNRFRVPAITPEAFVRPVKKKRNLPFNKNYLKDRRGRKR